jgi:hypothetical protein
VSCPGYTSRWAVNRGAQPHPIGFSLPFVNYCTTSLHAYSLSVRRVACGRRAGLPTNKLNIASGLSRFPTYQVSSAETRDPSERVSKLIRL